MHRSVRIIVDPKRIYGSLSVATLLCSINKVDSKSLAWPTTNERKKVRQISYQWHIPLTESAIFHLNMHKEREQANKIQLDKSKFYRFLKSTESKDCLERGKLGKRVLRVNHIKQYMVPPQRPVHRNDNAHQTDVKDVIYRMLQDISFRKAPKTRRLRKTKSAVEESDLLDLEFKPKDKLVTLRHQKLKNIPDLLIKSKNIETNLIFSGTKRKKEQTETLDLSALYPKCIKKERQFKRKEKLSDKKSELMSALDTKINKKSKQLKIIEKLPDKESKQKETLHMSALDSKINRNANQFKIIEKLPDKESKLKESTDLSELHSNIHKKAKQELIKRIENIPNKEGKPLEPNDKLAILKTNRKSHDSSADYRKRSVRHRSMSIDSSENRRSKMERKGKLIQKYDFVNKEILESLQDPKIIDEFLKNVAILATKTCSLFRKRFIKNERIGNSENPIDVDQYLDDLNKMVKKARLSIHKKHVDKNSLKDDETVQDRTETDSISSGAVYFDKSYKQKRLKEDDISRDLRILEKLVSEGKPIGIRRKLMNDSDESLQRPLKAYSSDNSSVSTIISDIQQFESDRKPEEDQHISVRQSKYDDTLNVQPKLQRLEMPEFDIELERNLPFVPPISYEELAKLSPEEFMKYFSGLEKDNKSMLFRKLSMANLRADHPLTYIYRVDQVKRFLQEPDVSISELDNISFDDIDINEFLYYPYSEKYTEKSIESKISPSVPTRKIRTTKEFKMDKPKLKQKDQKASQENEKIELNVCTGEPTDIPEKIPCCICNAIKHNKPIKDDPLIIRMKQEMKRLELKAYIKEKQTCLTTSFDKNFSNTQKKCNHFPVLVPCGKPSTVCNQIYPANVFYRNNA